MRRALVALASGGLFGAGLVVSGMASPSKVLGFLALGPGWDPALAFVMAGALAVTVPGFAWLRRRGRTVLGEELARPAATRIDTRLIAGSLLFGVGWGLAGYCPGPAIVGAGLGQAAALVFLPAMLAGGWIAGRLAH